MQLTELGDETNGSHKCEPETHSLAEADKLIHVGCKRVRKCKHLVN